MSIQSQQVNNQSNAITNLQTCALNAKNNMKSDINALAFHIRPGVHGIHIELEWGDGPPITIQVGCDYARRLRGLHFTSSNLYASTFSPRLDLEDEMVARCELWRLQAYMCLAHSKIGDDFIVFWNRHIDETSLRAMFVEHAHVTCKLLESPFLSAEVVVFDNIKDQSNSASDSRSYDDEYDVVCEHGVSHADECELCPTSDDSYCDEYGHPVDNGMCPECGRCVDRVESAEEIETRLLSSNSDLANPGPLKIGARSITKFITKGGQVIVQSVVQLEVSGSGVLNLNVTNFLPPNIKVIKQKWKVDIALSGPAVSVRFGDWVTNAVPGWDIFFRTSVPMQSITYNVAVSSVWGTLTATFVESDGVNRPNKAVPVAKTPLGVGAQGKKAVVGKALDKVVGRPKNNKKKKATNYASGGGSGAPRSRSPGPAKRRQGPTPEDVNGMPKKRRNRTKPKNLRPLGGVVGKVPSGGPPGQQGSHFGGK